MASSGVWENVFLSITLTLDGVCRMLWFIILDGFVCQNLTYLSFLLNFDILLKRKSVISLKIKQNEKPTCLY